MRQTIIPSTARKHPMLQAPCGRRMPPARLLAGLALMGALLLALSASRVEAATILVADGPALEAAVASANSGDVLQLNGGNYYVDETLLIEGKTITIDGNGATIIGKIAKDATYFHPIIEVDSYTGPAIVLNLNNLTVQGGKKEYGISANFELEGLGTVNLNGVNVTQNQGGGIYVIGGTLTLNNSTVSGNSSGGYGGGIDAGSLSGTIILDDSTVSGNSGELGGGIFQYDGTLILKDGTSVHDNIAYSAGGGIFNNEGSYFGVVVGFNVYDNTPNDLATP